MIKNGSQSGIVSQLLPNCFCEFAIMFRDGNNGII
jgi:hypothetical protein